MSFYPNVIGDKDVEGAHRIDVVDPSTGKPFASVAAGTATDVNAAVAPAAAVADEWASTPPAARGRLMRALSALITSRRDELAELSAKTPASRCARPTPTSTWRPETSSTTPAPWRLSTATR